jgi:hypothetical protein
MGRKEVERWTTKKERLPAQIRRRSQFRGKAQRATAQTLTFL